MIRRSTFLGIAAAAAVSLAHVHAAEAAPPTKDECVQAHGKGQDLRESRQLADAKRLFLVCAQQTCPALIQSDCARFGEELERTVPSVSFTARDAKGRDLPDTQVFVDDKLVATGLGDGKAYDVDPGSHHVKFVHAGATVSVDVVAAVGEKGRNVIANFDSGGGPGAPGGSQLAGSSQGGTTTEPAEPSRPVFPLVVAGVGGAALITGVILAVVGNGKVPSACNTSNDTCKAAPGDKVFDDASSARKLTNAGLGIAIGGLAVGIGGLVWYLLSPKESTSSTSAKLLLNGFTF